MNQDKKSRLSIISGTLLLLLILFNMGCKKDFLDRKPLGQYTTDNFPYPQGAGPYDQNVYAAYASLRTYQTTVFGYVGAVSIRSDDADKGSTPADAPAQLEMDNFPVNPTNGLTNDLWTGYFATVTDCNVILDQVGKDSANTPVATKLLAQGEARFLRGYAYFMLVRFFGNVPIVDTVLSDISASNKPQSTPAEVYAFIEKDLQFAATALPQQWDAKYIGRATSGAANGLLAKVYLYEKKWQDAMSTAGLVINSGVYNLNTPYDKIFTEDGENSSGSIFEIQAYADANHKTDSYGCQYANVQGVRGAGNFDLGWGFNVPSENLVNAYEEGDPREKSTILFTPSPEPTRYGEVFPAEPNPRYNMKVYTNPAIRNSVGSRAGYWMNVRILRYSDVLLMYAEAANELGQTDEALQKLEMVRARARNGDNSILPEVTTTDQSQLRDAIRHERRIELAMESERFFDIVRWGIADNVMAAAGKTNFSSSRDALLPIPQTQLDLSKGVLHQNPGY
ncbi:RagB/SusD family nutrient uptake outer membrane protein [Hanamia caeni]|uniref:RagB/SusD family nutrient uptake outer membrane protein n=1 Tax=Hanamia caeni TaxID=2294116 RepID=A0A3M9N6I5_9BACT|nr:RagB/SusD family nutrient uptake outer membrane protein [Hanamia caeni]RNI33369.1 RagB/SusD family nutrient uptake outer membrane protein [Hanamia caeni]